MKCLWQAHITSSTPNLAIGVIEEIGVVSTVIVVDDGSDAFKEWLKSKKFNRLVNRSINTVTISEKKDLNSIRKALEKAASYV